MVAAEGGAPSPLGPWAGADFKTTAGANAGVGADDGLPSAVRFLSGVAKLIRRRMAQQGAEADPARLAVFLLEPNARAYAPEQVPKRVPMLDNGLTAVTGRLWFVNEIAVMGKYFELDDGDDDSLFRVVTDSLGLGQVPAIVFDPRTKPATVRFYRCGLSDADTCDVIVVGTADVSLPRICEQIDHVHRKCLITPEAQGQVGRLWENGEKWWPMSQAERLVQYSLRLGLTTAFPTCTVREEQTSVPGRLDLEIEESNALNRSQITRHAILELKVLRSFRSSGTTVSDQENLHWVESGVRQAAAYRDDWGARAAALCCFDMRRQHTGQQCFDHVKSLASELTVELKHWFLFSTSERYREFITSER